MHYAHTLTVTTIVYLVMTKVIIRSKRTTAIVVSLLFKSIMLQNGICKKSYDWKYAQLYCDRKEPYDGDIITVVRKDIGMQII